VSRQLLANRGRGGGRARLESASRDYTSRGLSGRHTVEVKEKHSFTQEVSVECSQMRTEQKNKMSRFMVSERMGSAFHL
jgi:hypothetical protein